MLDGLSVEPAAHEDLALLPASGCVLYACLAGVHPFPMDSLLANIQARGAGIGPLVKSSSIHNRRRLQVVLIVALSMQARFHLPTEAEAAVIPVHLSGHSQLPVRTVMVPRHTRQTSSGSDLCRSFG